MQTDVHQVLVHACHYERFIGNHGSLLVHIINGLQLKVSPL